MDKKELGAYLKKIREQDLHLSLSEMSRATTLSESALNEIEQGKIKKPDIETTFRLAKEYRVDHSLILDTFVHEALTVEVDE